MKIEIINDRPSLMFGEDNEISLTIAKTGEGKTYAMRSMLHSYSKLNPRPVIICLADPKKVQEMNYLSLPARKQKQLESLKLIGRQPEGKDCIFYEPFTFNVPKNKKMPPTRWFTLSLKELRNASWSMLIESESDSEAVGLMSKASSEIDKQTGLWGFLHKIQRSISGSVKNREKKVDLDNFALTTAMGNKKSLGEISRHLTPFKIDYLLAKDSSETNLNWGELLNDNKNIHCFNTSYISEEKISDFVTLSILDQIIKNRHLSKHQIILIIPEVRVLVPDKAENSSKKFLAIQMRKLLSLCRGQGKGGISVLMCSQVFYDIHRSVRNSPNNLFLGELCSEDLDKLPKVFHFDREVQNNLKRMEYKFCFYLVGTEQKEDPIMFNPPPEMLKEKNYDFFEEYKKVYPEKMKDYIKFYSEMEKNQKDEINKHKEIAKRQEKIREEESKKLKETRDKERLEREGNSKDSEKIKVLKKLNKEQLKQTVIETKRKHNDWSYRKIEEELNGLGIIVSYKTIANYINEYIKENPQNLDNENLSELNETKDEVPLLGDDFELPKD